MNREILSVFLLLSLSILLVTEALADCDSDWDACFERANRQGEGCWNSCESQYYNDDDAWDRCTARCQDEQDRDWNRCDSDFEICERQAEQELDKQGHYGSRRSGEDGCYFGECPGDEPEQRQNPPSQQPGQTVPQQIPQQPLAMSWICQTPTFWCTMFQAGPVGHACYCNSYYGAVWGQIIPQQY